MLCAFLGPLFDALGPRVMFACGQTLNAVGLLIPVLSQSYWPVFVGWLLFEAAYNIIAPAIQAAMTTAIDDPSRVCVFALPFFAQLFNPQSKCVNSLCTHIPSDAHFACVSTQ